MSDFARDVATLLRMHGLDGVREEALPGGGYTAARLTRIERGGRRFVLKRIRAYQTDWVRRLTDDRECREVEFALSPLVQLLPPSVAVPALGAARHNDEHVLLMRDISEHLLPEETIEDARLDAIVAAIADMHAAFWDDPMRELVVNWADVRQRLTLLSPQTARRLRDEGSDFGVVGGWEAFDRLAPAPARDLAQRLFADVSPLVSTLEALPKTLVHGDLKVANMGYGDGKLWLLDWTSVMHAAVTMDVYWFIAVNSSLLPEPLEDVLDRYATHLERTLGAVRFAAARWPRQRAAIMLAGLLTYGWGKANDAAAGRPDELRWWCDGAVEAARLLDL